MKSRKSTEADSGARVAKWKVLVIDDHPIVREGLGQRIAAEPDLTVCATIASAREAMPAIERHKPDLAIVDLTLGDGHGIELIKDIRTFAPETRILVFSMHDEELYGERVLRAGAHGYLMKSEPPERVIEAVRRVASGGTAISTRLADRLAKAVGAGRKHGTLPAEVLSDRELEVFHMVGRGIGTKDIAARLNRSTKTIETHRMRIKEKLQLRDNTELIATAASWAQQAQ
jgi:DNA-binding NarL/FixJ family response regulator